MARIDRFIVLSHTRPPVGTPCDDDRSIDTTTTEGTLVIDMDAWRAGDEAQRAEIARAVDENLRSDGFLLVGNHGIPAELIDALREAVGEFFVAPHSIKAQYECRVGETGWMPPGVEANSYASGVPSPADLKETFRAMHEPPGHESPNVWPVQFSDVRTHFTEYMRLLWDLAMDLYELMGVALGLGPDIIARHASAAVSSVNINRYPPLVETGPVADGQFRVGAHSDFGVLTILDRQVGVGGLQVQTADGVWRDAPHEPGTMAVNIGDMLAHWTGGAWRATVHRVLPPSPDAPEEELVSLVGFCGVDPDTIIETLPIPGAVPVASSVTAGEYMAEKLAQIDVAAS